MQISHLISHLQLAKTLAEREGDTVLVYLIDMALLQASAKGKESKAAAA